MNIPQSVVTTSRSLWVPKKSHVIFQNHDPTVFINMTPGSKAYPRITSYAQLVITYVMCSAELCGVAVPLPVVSAANGF